MRDYYILDSTLKGQVKLLIITEKPNVAQAFGTALSVPFIKDHGFYSNGEIEITNCVGHLYELAKPEEYDESFKHWSFDILPIIPEKYLYKQNDTTIKQLKKVSFLLKKHSHDKIVIATDADREGEVIARIVFQESGLTDISHCYRFWVSEALTPQVIKKGMSNLKPWNEYNNLAKKGFARQHADWLVGMNLSPYETLLAGHKITLPVGRVQTAILAAIAQRNNEVKNFVPTPYYQCIAHLKDNNGNKSDAYLINQETGKFFFPQINNYINEAHNYSGTNKSITLQTETKQKTLNPPKLLSLTELQKIAAKDFDYSSSRTLEIAQSLYEKHKCLSYPRTPSSVLGDDDVELFKEKFDLLKGHYEISKYCNENLISQDNKHIFNSKKLDSHHALIPLDLLPEDATQAEKNIYITVLNRFFMSCMDSCIYDEKTLFIMNGIYKYKAIIKIIVKEGWKIAEKQLAPNGAKKEEAEELQYFDEKTCILKNTEIVKKMTTPKKEFTETSLLSFMENPTMEDSDEKLIGLGTPATRGNILAKLEEYNYVVKQSKKYYATEKGYFLLKLLFKNPLTAKIANIAQTTKWEKDLESSPESFEENIIAYITECVKTHPEIEVYEKKGIGKCPRCNGRIFEGQKSFFCEHINKEPKCNFIIYKNTFGSNLTAKDAELLLQGKQTGVKNCKGKTGKSYKAKLSFNLNTMKMEQAFVNKYDNKKKLAPNGAN
ncbi:type IA DNA topoisomerase [Treponema pectinovorum]|uniref:type IA DNA topoisomerase n=1 Tax=Treponema pectinovorum TaxID=164 RepID=UPI0011F177EB|nr:type IA DNA topoisomerase [Treponema pectinovorum]